MAFVYGDIGDGKGILARLHRADVIGDVFGGAKPIHAALAQFKTAGRGVIVFLRDGTAGVPVAEIPHEGDTGADAARSRQWREIGLGAQILKDLGISSIRLLTSSKRTYVGLGGFGIEIVATEPIESWRYFRVRFLENFATNRRPFFRPCAMSALRHGDMVSQSGDCRRCRRSWPCAGRIGFANAATPCGCA